TIDRQLGSDTIVVWVTNRSSGEVKHTNAVEVDAVEAVKALRSLTRCCAVLVTEGSVLDGLPVEGDPLTTADIDAMVAATEEHQRAILTAVGDYKARSGSKALVSPNFPPSVQATDFQPADDTAVERAFTTANYMSRAWRRWLTTDEERHRRTARPKTGETPWIMPEALNAPEVAVFPAAFAARFHEQPLI
ncbi:MAG TPA: hypothetical protein VF635_12105, partial [Propionibacteriaceae bacterium]